MNTALNFYLDAKHGPLPKWGTVQKWGPTGPTKIGPLDEEAVHRLV